MPSITSLDISRTTLRASGRTYSKGQVRAPTSGKEPSPFFSPWLLLHPPRVDRDAPFRACLSGRDGKNVVAPPVRTPISRDRCCCCCCCRNCRDPFLSASSLSRLIFLPSLLLPLFFSPSVSLSFPPVFLSFSVSSLRYYLLFTLFLSTSLSRFSLALRSFLLVLLLPLLVFLALSPSLSFSLSPYSFLRSDVVSWGQCLLDRILSRNIPAEEEEEEQEEVEDDLSTSARDCNRRRVCARARHVLRGDRSAPFFAPRGAKYSWTQYRSIV